MILGLLTGVLGLVLSSLPFWLDLEEQVGLGLLFSLRGARPAPEDVVVVSIDTASADALGGLPPDPVKWSRSLHAQLTDNLIRAGAKVIVFDIFFDQPRVPDEDDRFARAIADAGNVVLAKYLTRETVPYGDRGKAHRQLNLERLVSPLPRLGNVAAGAASFPLPKRPVRLHQYWKFTSGAGLPTLPVVALQVFAADAYGGLMRLEAAAGQPRLASLPADGRALLAERHVDDVATKLRAVFERNPELGGAMLEAARTMRIDDLRRVRALIRMYEGAGSEYLNFYGPPRTIRTVPYHEVVSARAATDLERLGLRGKAVFVGVSDLRNEQKDGFYTVFSRGGVDISGAEVAATAFANLLGDEHIRPPRFSGELLVLFGSGMIAGVLCAILGPGAAAVAGLGVGAGYVALAVSRFTAAQTWYPIAAPLCEIPAAFVGALLWRYIESNRERRQMRSVFSQYLPGPVIDELLRNSGGGADTGHVVYGICLATDAERYTSVAESMGPEELARFVNRYYAIVFEPIRRHGGTISDVVGDAALAFWASAAPDAMLRTRACHAACELSAAVDRFNRESGFPLTTRIGLHSGQMVLGHVGAMDHYEYRAVGDIVNTAARIQELNKLFHSRILVSGEVLTGVGGFLTRRLGTFVLAGKSKPVVIYELICREADATAQERSGAALFAEGVAAYERRSWLEAATAFDACLSETGDDEAARFYLNACAECRARHPDEPWEPVFRMRGK